MIVPIDGSRPLPVPTRLSQPYWDGCKRRELTYMRCRSCGHPFFPPAEACICCLSLELEWAHSAGHGLIDTYTVIEKEPSPGFPLPTVMAIVNLAEGYCMFSDIIDCDPRDVRCDMPVEVVFHDASDDITLPMFRPTSAPSRSTNEGDR
jgi:uncharacterized OB-fold protein